VKDLLYLPFNIGVKRRTAKSSSRHQLVALVSGPLSPTFTLSVQAIITTFAGALASFPVIVLSSRLRSTMARGSAPAGRNLSQSPKWFDSTSSQLAPAQ
jgi:hypothetical protein